MTTTETRYRIECRGEGEDWQEYEIRRGDDPVAWFPGAINSPERDEPQNRDIIEWRLVKMTITTETEVVKTATRKGSE